MREIERQIPPCAVLPATREFLVALFAPYGGRVHPYDTEQGLSTVCSGAAIAG
jgi:hypothetical protein